MMKLRNEKQIMCLLKPSGANLENLPIAIWDRCRRAEVKLWYGFLWGKSPTNPISLHGSLLPEIYAEDYLNI